MGRRVEMVEGAAFRVFVGNSARHVDFGVPDR